MISEYWNFLFLTKTKTTVGADLRRFIFKVIPVHYDKPVILKGMLFEE